MVRNGEDEPGEGSLLQFKLKILLYYLCPQINYMRTAADCMIL
jgi:hypothetical protein